MTQSQTDTDDASRSSHGDEHEMYDIVSEEGEPLERPPIQFLRDVLAADQTLRTSDGNADNTFTFWWEVGDRNGLQYRNVNWTGPRPASETDARAVLDDAEDLTMQIVPKEDWT